MHRRWLVLAAVLALCAQAYAEEPLSQDFSTLSSSVKKDGQELAEKVSKRASPRPVVRILSWNIQTFGASVSPEREAAYGEILGQMLSTSRSARIMALQEIANATGAAKVSGLLPGGTDRWRGSFTNTNDGMDNGFFAANDVGMDCERPLFAEEGEDGRWRGDREKMVHPPRAAHIRVGDLDFTLITVHLTFKGGDTRESGRELWNLMNWLAQYLSKDGADPDVVIAGDFNIPTKKGASGGLTLEDFIGKHPTFGSPEATAGGRLAPWALVPFVDQATSRNRQGKPVNNYDHFLLTGDLYNEEYSIGSAGVVPHDYMHAIEAQHGVLVSDHYPISAGFYTSGTGNDGRPIAPDGDSACGALLSMAPLQ